MQNFQDTFETRKRSFIIGKGSCQHSLMGLQESETETRSFFKN